MAALGAPAAASVFSHVEGEGVQFFLSGSFRDVSGGCRIVGRKVSGEMWSFGGSFNKTLVQSKIRMPVRRQNFWYGWLSWQVLRSDCSLRWIQLETQPVRGSEICCVSGNGSPFG